MTDPRVELLLKYFFSRTDKIAFYAAWNAPQHTNGGDLLEAILNGHVLGYAAPITAVHYTNRRGSDHTNNPVRIGSYTPNADGLTKWLCIDFDGGPEHANGLIDPKVAVIEAQKTASSFRLSSHIECSGGGHGWHLWVFFDPMVPAKQARQLGLFLCPRNLRCQNGDTADPKSNKGMEVFPKQPRIKKDGFGNLIWLPWWWNAQPGGNQFYQFDESKMLSQFLPESFTTVSPEQVEQTLTAHVRIAPESTSTRRNTQSTQQPSDSKANASAWIDWRSTALKKLRLEDVYGSLLTGRNTGDEWLECRDPASASGDQNPSAGIATGTGTVERGAFHSFLTGQTISVFDFLINQGKATDFRSARSLIEQLTGIAYFAEPQVASSESLRQIVTNKRPIFEVITDAWEVIYAENKPPRIFINSANLVRVTRTSVVGDGIKEIGEAELFGYLIRKARWIKTFESGISDTYPSREVIRDMLALPDSDLPELDDIKQIPVFTPDGQLLTQKGYHPSLKLWLDIPDSLSSLEIPYKPTPADIAAAKSLLLEELFVDFPLENNADKAHVIAALIHPFIRKMIFGQTPMFVVEAPSPGTGKSLLCEMISIVISGRLPESFMMPNTDEEVRKILTTMLSEPQPMMLFDNVTNNRKLSSQSLASALTKETWVDRLLGGNKKARYLTNSLWMMTGNNPQLSRELSRRTVHIRMITNLEDPSQGRQFKHPNLTIWAIKNRRELVKAVLVILQAWIAAGRPLGSEEKGKFEAWAQTVGGILAVSGIPGFLENADAAAVDVDPDRMQWRELVAEWWDKYQNQPVKISEINTLCEDKGLLNGQRAEGSARSQQTRLGPILRSMVKKVVLNYRICAPKDWRYTRGKFNVYCLQDVSGEGGRVASNETGNSVSEDVSINLCEWNDEN